jgi:hypothetical protein
MQRVFLASAAAVVLLGVPMARAQDYRAGVARVKITPLQPMWMSGYAGRDRPAEGTLIDLWAKAIALEDGAGERLVLVTLDLIGLDRDVSAQICRRVEQEYLLERSRIALCCSHTHTGPVVGRNLLTMYSLDEPQQAQVRDYTQELENQIVGLVGKALEQLAPARLAWGRGHSTLAVNRRNNVEAAVPELRQTGRLKGPVDYDVPVLAARRPDGSLLAVVFGYACHATVLPIFKWSGDYPGFAQLALEEAHPQAMALFFAGCGGDQNPLPRRDAARSEPQAAEQFGVERAMHYGRQVAQSVDAVLQGAMHPVEGGLAARYQTVDLPLAALPTRQELELSAQSSNKYEAQRARLLLAKLDSGQALESAYPYPVQLWRLGNDLRLVLLGGEVVVDYSLRLKAELGRENTWVAAYANDVMAYIPSLRVLKEGGYEGGGSMVYYGLPAIWSEQVEEAIVRGVRELVGSIQQMTAPAR